MSDGLDQPRLGLNEEPEEERREDVWEDPDAEPEPEAGPELEPEAEPELEPEPEPEPEPEEDVPAEEDELPRLRGPEHAAGGLQIPDGYGVIEGEPTGSRRAVGIVVARFNGELTGELLRRALDELERLGVGREAVTVIPVPGAFELPRLRSPEHAGGELQIPDGYGVIEGEPTGNRRAVGSPSITP